MSPEQKIIFNNIKGRRTIYPPAYSDKSSSKETLEKIVEAGTWAPNHGNTEPWRFTVFKDDSKIGLANFLGEEYIKQFPGDLYNERKYENATQWPILTPAIIAVGMKRHAESQIPEIEEERAVSTAIQNMLLMANSFGIVSYWSTGKVVYSDAMKSYLNLQIEDQVIGFIYFGYPKQKSSPKKRTSFNQFIQWKNEHES